MLALLLLIVLVDRRIPAGRIDARNPYARRTGAGVGPSGADQFRRRVRAGERPGRTAFPSCCFTARLSFDIARFFAIYHDEVLKRRAIAADTSRQSGIYSEYGQGNEEYTDADRQAGIDVPVTPEQQAIIDKMVADAADMARASKVHDRAQAIKDALTAKAIAQAIKDALAAQATALTSKT